MLKVYLCILLERSQFSGECNCAFVILCNIGLGHPALEKKRRKKKKLVFLFYLPQPHSFAVFSAGQSWNQVCRRNKGGQWPLHRARLLCRTLCLGWARRNKWSFPLI